MINIVIKFRTWGILYLFPPVQCRVSLLAPGIPPRVWPAPSPCLSSDSAEEEDV